MASLRNALTTPPVVHPWAVKSPPQARKRTSRLSIAGLSHRLFQALDGHQLTASRKTWRLEVYSIVDEGETRWIQVALHGLESHELMVAAPRSSDAKQIMAALKTWIGQLRLPVPTMHFA
jgi:hypothetical protein